MNDTIKLGNIEGKVERIGFRATRLRSTNGSAVIIPNKKLIGENLENLTDRDTSGVKMVINLKYGIAEEDLKKMIADLKEMIHRTLHVKTPVEVTIEGFGENVFQLQIAYHLIHPMTGGQTQGEVKQQINLKAYGIVAQYSGNQDVTVESKADTAIPDEEQVDNREEDKKKDDII